MGRGPHPSSFSWFRRALLASIPALHLPQLSIEFHIAFRWGGIFLHEPLGDLHIDPLLILPLLRRCSGSVSHSPQVSGLPQAKLR